MKSFYFFSFLLFFYPLCAEINYQVVSERQYEEDDIYEARIYEDVVLDCGKEGHSHFSISIPKRMRTEKLPCVAIIGGLATGRSSLKFVPEHGNYALVAYEYPKKLKQLGSLIGFKNIFGLRQAALAVPTQLLSMVSYLQKKGWIAKEPICLMSYSFGSIFTPVTFIRGEAEGIQFGPSVLAYGGAGIYCIFRPNVKGPSFLKSPIAHLFAFLFRPIEPLRYAAHMKGDFLIVNGVYDHQIPMRCASRLQDSIPEPKTVINLETDHLHPDNKELTLRLIQISLDWLSKKREKLYGSR